MKVSFIKTRKREGGKTAGEARRRSSGNELRLKRLSSTRKDPATGRLGASVSRAQDRGLGRGSRLRSTRQRRRSGKRGTHNLP